MPGNGVNYISGSLQVSRVKAAKSTPDKPSKPVRHPRPLFPQPGPNAHSLATSPADAIRALLGSTETAGGEEVKGMEKWKERRKRSLEEAFEFSWAKADLGKNNKTGQRWWDEWTTERVGGKSTRPRPPGGKENVRPTGDDYHKVLAHPDLAGTAKYEHDHNPT